MIWQVVVVFVFLPIIGQGLKLGEECTDPLGEIATCTRISTCKAAVHELALAFANVSQSDAARALCGFDNEPLICCKTVPEFYDISINNVIPSENSIVTNLTESDLSITSTTDLNTASVFNDSVQIVVLSTNTTVTSSDTVVTTDASTNILSSVDDTNVFIAGIYGTPSVIVDDLPEVNNETTSSITTESSSKVTLVSGSEFESTISPAFVTGIPILVKLTESPEQIAAGDGLPLQSNANTEIPDEPISSSDSSTKVTMVSDWEHNVTIPPEHITEPPIVIKLTTATPPVPNVTLDVLPLQSNNTSEVLDEPTPSPITEPSVVKEITTEESLDHIFPARSVCGYQLIRNRVPNAIISSTDEFPWMALLKYQDGYGRDIGFKCVGTLITNRHVITSSFCVVDGPESFELKSIRLGEWSISSPSDCVYDNEGIVCPDEVVDVGIQRIFLHPESKNNIALIRMERSVNFTNYVRPICLPIEYLGAPPDNSILTSSGWAASKSGCLLDIKSKIRLPAISKESCSGIVSNLEDQACLYALSMNTICRTDYGGPVMAVDPENTAQWYLEGVIPEGFFCNIYGSIGFYTRLTNHISWIVSILRADVA